MVEFSAAGDYWSNGQFYDSKPPWPGLADSLPDIPYCESHFVHWLEMMGYDVTYSTKKETGNAERQTSIFRPSKLPPLSTLYRCVRWQILCGVFSSPFWEPCADRDGEKGLIRQGPLFRSAPPFAHNPQKTSRSCRTVSGCYSFPPPSIAAVCRSALFTRGNWLGRKDSNLHRPH